MPIYNGTQLVSPGVDKVYNGSSLVYSAAPVSKFTAVATDTISFNGAGACVYDNKIYIFGGYDTSTSTLPPSDKARVFDPSNNSLTTLTSLPEARMYTSAVTWSDNTNGQQIGIIGGGPARNQTSSTTGYVYNITNDTYISKTGLRALSTRNIYYSPTQLKIYSTGGYSNVANSGGTGTDTPSYIDINTFAETTFTESSSNDFGSFKGGRSCYYNNTQYIFGTVAAKIDSISSYTSSKPNVSIVYKIYENFSKQGTGAGLVGHNGCLYVIGSRISSHNVIFKYNISTGVCEQLDDVMPETPASTYGTVQAFSINNAIYILLNNTIYKYTP